MSDLFWLTDAQMARLELFFQKFHGKPRVGDRRVLTGIIFINRNGYGGEMRPKNMVHIGPCTTAGNDEVTRASSRR